MLRPRRSNRATTRPFDRNRARVQPFRRSRLLGSLHLRALREWAVRADADGQHVRAGMELHDGRRRRLIAEHGEAGKTGSDYIADVLEAAGLKLELTLQEEAEDQYEEEFEDLLHFKTLEDAEVSVMRLDELMRKFRSQGENAAVERVLNVARLGKRRAEMISRNQKVEAPKRAEKEEIANWFRIWLENPDAFFDWLDLRKQSPEFKSKFPQAGLVE